MSFGAPEFQVNVVGIPPSAGSTGEPGSLPPGEWVRLGILAEGQGLLLRGGRQDPLRQGDGWVAVGEGGPDHRWTWLTACRAILLALPAGQLRRRAISPSPGVWRLPADTPGLQVLASFLGMVRDELARESSPAFRAVVANHVHDLAGHVIGASREGRPSALAAGPRTVRLRRALELIEHNLTDPSLTPASLAEALGVSVGYLGKLFAAFGTTPARHIRRLRLERAYVMLVDPAYAHHPPADIAAVCGIADFRTFRRGFRAEFGLAPNRLRNG